MAPLARTAAHGLKNIFDLAPDRDGWVLVAAVKGLFRFRPDGGDIERIPGPKTSEEIKSLCRDAQGRLWAAGDGLYVSTDEGQRWEAADLPMLGLTYTSHPSSMSTEPCMQSVKMRCADPDALAEELVGMLHYAAHARLDRLRGRRLLRDGRTRNVVRAVVCEQLGRLRRSDDLARQAQRGRGPEAN